MTKSPPFLAVFGGTMKGEIIMEKNYCKETKVLTISGTYISEAEATTRSTDEIVCYIDTTGYTDEQFKQMDQMLMDFSSWETFLAATTINDPHYTVDTLMNFLKEIDGRYYLLQGCTTEWKLGAYVSNFYSFLINSDGTMTNSFTALARNVIDQEQAIYTRYGYLLVLGDWFSLDDILMYG